MGNEQSYGQAQTYVAPNPNHRPRDRVPIQDNSEYNYRNREPSRVVQGIVVEGNVFASQREDYCLHCVKKSNRY